MLTELDALLAPYDRSHAPGGAVAVARGGRPIYRRAFGMAEVAHGHAVQPGTTFPAGSIAKQVTCAALLLLARDGALALDDRLARWLPELPPAHHDVTLVQLMRHQGGVRCYLDHWMFNAYRTLPPGLPWAIQSRQQSLNFAAGSRTAYSNGGYLLLTAVIERASGMAFADFVARRLFRPAGMFASRLGGAAASPYTLAGEHWTPAAPLMEESFGDGGLVTSVDDLLRWAAFLRSSAGPVSLDALLAPGEAAAAGPSDYRFGLILQHWRGIRLAHHAGGLPGANSVLIMAPDHDLDIALLFNRAAPATGIGLKIAELLLGEALAPAPEAPPSADFADLIGSYWAEGDDFLFALADRDGGLGLSLFGDPAFPLEGWDGDAAALPFWADAGAAQIRFRRGGAAGALDWFDGTAWSPARRLTAAALSPEVPNGRFHSAEAAATLHFSAEDGALFLHADGALGPARYRAEAVGEDLFRFWPAQFSAGKLARLIRRDGAVTALAISTQRSRAMLFPRSADPRS